MELPSPIKPAVINIVKNTMHINEFGKPKTELCQTFKMLEQLKTALILQDNTACGLLKISSLARVCRNEAIKPTTPDNAITKYDFCCIDNLFMVMIIHDIYFK